MENKTETLSAQTLRAVCTSNKTESPVSYRTQVEWFAEKGSELAQRAILETDWEFPEEEWSELDRAYEAAWMALCDITSAAQNRLASQR